MASRIALRRAALGLGAVAALCALGFGARLGIEQATGNIHPVIAGEAYRSAQLSPRQLRAVIAEHGIRTIVNLRGEHPGSDWYDAEIAAAAEAGVAHVDFQLSATRLVGQAQAAALVALIETAEKPVLIHCRGGADRSGLAAALFVAAVARGDHDAAEAQLSLRYGHVPIPWVNRAYAMDESWEALEPWLGFEES